MADFTGAKQRGQGQRFAAGVSGNPLGRPRGARNKTTLAVEALMQGQAEAITSRCIENALAGDPVAIRLVLDRVAPSSRDRTLTLALPPLVGPQDAPAVAAALLHAAAAGELTPAEAAAMLGLLDGWRKAIETADLEARIAVLESGRTRSVT